MSTKKTTMITIDFMRRKEITIEIFNLKQHIILNG